MSDTLGARRAELLQIARRSRIKWVLDEKDVEYLKAQDGSEDDRAISDTLKNKIPAAECIQNVLNFLTDVISDGEVCDVASIAAGIIDYDDFDDVQYNLLKHKDPNVTDTYNEFLNKLTLPASTEVVKSMQQFVTKFFADYHNAKANPAPLEPLAEPTEDELQSWPTRVWTFLDHTYDNMKELPVWSHESPVQFEATCTHCEKFIFSKLYPILFATDIEDPTQNERIKERIDSLIFLTAEHLDIKCAPLLYEQYAKKHAAPNTVMGANKHHKGGHLANKSEQEILLEVLEQPISLLVNMAIAKCPQDKLLCVKRCTMSIAQILKNCRSDGRLPGADELLPMMIYTIKCANPANLYSHKKFLQRYTRPNMLMGGPGYIITSFVSAVEFLENVDAQALTMEPEEYDRAILQSKMKAKAVNEKILQQHVRNEHARKELKNGHKGRKSRSNSHAAEGLETAGKSDDEADIEKLLSEHKKALLVNSRTDAVSVQEIYRRRKALATQS